MNRRKFVLGLGAVALPLPAWPEYEAGMRRAMLRIQARRLGLSPTATRDEIDKALERDLVELEAAAIRRSA